MRRSDREVTRVEDICGILKACKTCHIAMVDEGMPYIVPLSYGYEMNGNELILYLHSAFEGRKINILRKNKKVCFEMCDEGNPQITATPCNSGYYYSSIIGNGEVVFINDVEEKKRALTMMFLQQSGKEVTFTQQQANTVCVFKIVSTDYAGKKKRKDK